MTDKTQREIPVDKLHLILFLYFIIAHSFACIERSFLTSAFLRNCGERFGVAIAWDEPFDLDVPVQDLLHCGGRCGGVLGLNGHFMTTSDYYRVKID